jgi:IS5 family transposase
LSDSAVEEFLYDSAATHRFVGIDLGRYPVPNETTVCKFRHLLEKHGLAADLFATVNRYLQDHGMRLSQGTIVDATIITHLPRPRSGTSNAIPRCARPRKAINGFSR